MSIRQAITDLSSFLESAPPQWRTPKMAEMSVDVSRRAAMIRSPIPEQEQAILEKKFLLAIETNDWNSIDSLDWNAITHFLWKSPLNLLSIHRFHFNYRRYLESGKTARTIKRLIYAYLEAYDPKREGIEWAGSLIRKILVQNRFLILGYWRQVESELHIFSTSPGPKKFALRCLDHPLSVYQPQIDIGLTQELARGGYAYHAYLAAWEIVTASPWQTKAELLRLERFLEWTKNEPETPFLRFPNSGKKLLQTLLSAPPRSSQACDLIGKFFTQYAEAWRKGDQSCIDPTPDQIKVVGEILRDSRSN